MDNEPIRVLLIDDDLGDSQMIRAMLAKAEYEEFKVDWVSNFEEAMDAFEAGDHDVFLLDYFLEDRTGLDLLKEAQEKGVDVPIIMLTGRAGRSVDEEAMELGASDYLVKGEIDPGVLEGVIRRVLGRRVEGPSAATLATEEGTQTEILHSFSAQDRPSPAGNATISELRFRAVFDATLSGVALVGLDGEIMEVNAAFAEFFSPTRRWTEGLSYLSLFHAADQEATKKEMDSLSNGERTRFEAARRFLVREGVVKWAHTTTTLIRSGDGAPDSFLVVVEEATEKGR